MKKYSIKFPIAQYSFFAVISFAFSLSVAAQYTPVAYQIKGTEHSRPIKETEHSRPVRDTELTRPRIVETEKKTIIVSSNIAFSSNDLEKQAFAMLNSMRSAKGLPALVWNEDVARIARMHSENMAKYKFFSHTGLDGRMVNDRADECGLSKWRAIGENIAYNRGYEKPADFAVERWMQSVGHRENILNNRWKESAVGVAVSNDGAYYFTQVFLVRK